MRCGVGEAALVSARYEECDTEELRGGGVEYVMAKKWKGGRLQPETMGDGAKRRNVRQAAGEKALANNLQRPHHTQAQNSSRCMHILCAACLYRRSRRRCLDTCTSQ